MPAPDAQLTAAQRQVRAVRRQALAEALVAARTAADMTQTELAEAAGLSRSAIARLEAGDAGIASDRLWDICVALGMRPSAFFRLAEADTDAAGTLGDA